MTNDSNLLGSLISKVLMQGAHLEFLQCQIGHLGIRIEQASFVLDLSGNSGEFALKPATESDSYRCPLWVELNRSQLESAANTKSSVQGVVLHTGEKGQVVHPRVEQLVLRCFEAPPFPLDDREELIYGAIFGFTDPVLIWESSESLLRVLSFSPPRGRPCVVVSSGLSEPWALEPAEIYPENASGAGYELMIETSNEIVGREFASWVRYVEQTNQHILPGNWLEFENEAGIPGLDIFGFIVVTPVDVPSGFPVGDALVKWHELIPVNKAQLITAKNSDVFSVAEKIRAGKAG